MWEYSGDGVAWLVWAVYQPAAPLYFHRQSFGAKRTSDIIQPQVGQQTATHSPPPAPPSTPHNYLRPSVYTVQQQILSNNSSQLTNSLISHLCRPVCSAIALDEEQLLNILAVGWLVSQWTTVILLNYILQPSAENRSILQCCEKWEDWACFILFISCKKAWCNYVYILVCL